MVSDLKSEHVLDLLFYNFYDLDRYNRAAMGDEVLVLGNRDALKNYVFQKHLKEKQALENISQQLKGEIHYLEQTDEGLIKEMATKATELIEMSEYLKNTEFPSFQERNAYKLKYEVMHLNYNTKFGEIGRLITEALKEKNSNKKGWSNFVSANKSKNKFLKAIEKKGGGKTLSTYQGRQGKQNNYSTMNDNSSTISNTSKISDTGKLQGWGVKPSQRAASSMNKKQKGDTLLDSNRRRNNISTAYHRSTTANMDKSRTNKRKPSMTVMVFYNSL